MKKIMQKTTLLFACLLTGYFAQAQLAIGFKTGVNIASQQIEFLGVSANTGETTGLVLGAVAAIPLTERLFLQPELTFIQKGSGSGFELEEDAKLKMNYAEIPVLVKFNFLNKPNVQLYLIGGPYFAIGLNGKVTYGEETESLDLADEEFKRLDTGIHLGIGLSKKIGKAALFIDFRLLAGTTNLITEEAVKLTNSGANGNIGVLFPLSKD